VAVDPTDPNNIAGNWQQDRWSNGGSHGLVASASTNGSFDGETPAVRPLRRSGRPGAGEGVRSRE
jgi:hypothetical protein